MTTENTQSSTFSCMTPVGYRMIVKERRVENKTKGGIILAQETQDAEQYSTMVGEVVAMGDGCYQHESYNGNPGANWVKILCLTNTQVIEWIFGRMANWFVIGF